jgi:hypothetical protein
VEEGRIEVGGLVEFGNGILRLASEKEVIGDKAGFMVYLGKPEISALAGDGDEFVIVLAGPVPGFSFGCAQYKLPVGAPPMVIGVRANGIPPTRAIRRLCRSGGMRGIFAEVGEKINKGEVLGFVETIANYLAIFNVVMREESAGGVAESEKFVGELVDGLGVVLGLGKEGVKEVGVFLHDFGGGVEEVLGSEGKVGEVRIKSLGKEVVGMPKPGGEPAIDDGVTGFQEYVVLGFVTP